MCTHLLTNDHQSIEHDDPLTDWVEDYGVQVDLAQAWLPMEKAPKSGNEPRCGLHIKRRGAAESVEQRRAAQQVQFTGNLLFRESAGKEAHVL